MGASLLAKRSVQTTQNKQAKKGPEVHTPGPFALQRGLRGFRFRLAQRAVQRAEQGLEAGGGDVFIDTHAMHRTFTVHAQLDVGRGLGVGARADGVFVVVHDFHRDRQTGHQRFQGETNLHWRGKGNGALEALVAGLPIPVEIMDYNEHAIGAGTNAKAAAYIELRVNGERAVHGVGIDENITTASFKALFSALNRSLSQPEAKAA